MKPEHLDELITDIEDLRVRAVGKLTMDTAIASVIARVRALNAEAEEWRRAAKHHEARAEKAEREIEESPIDWEHRLEIAIEAFEEIVEWRPRGVDGIGTPRRIAREALARCRAAATRDGKSGEKPGSTGT